MSLLEEIINEYDFLKNMLNNMNTTIAAECLYFCEADYEDVTRIACKRRIGAIKFLSCIKNPTPDDIIGALFYCDDYFSDDGYQYRTIKYVTCSYGVIDGINGWHRIRDEYIYTSFEKLVVDDVIKSVMSDIDTVELKKTIIIKAGLLKDKASTIYQNALTKKNLPKAIINHIIIPFLIY